MKHHDAFRILGLEPDASYEESRATYMALVQIFHPDRYRSMSSEVQREADKRMKEVTAAWDQVRKTVKPTESSSAPTDRHDVRRCPTCGTRNRMPRTAFSVRCGRCQSNIKLDRNEQRLVKPCRDCGVNEAESGPLCPSCVSRRLSTYFPRPTARQAAATTPMCKDCGSAPAQSGPFCAACQANRLGT